MNRIFRRFINYIRKEKKQIIFALFAFIIYSLYYLIFKENSEVISMAAPVVVAGAVAAGGATTGAVAAGTTAAGTAATTTAAGTATAGATTSGTLATAKGTASGAVQTANTAKSAANTANIQTTVKRPVNTEVNAGKTDIGMRTGNTPDALKGIKEKNTSLDPATSKSAQKEASTSEVEKAKKWSKKDRLSPETSNDDEENETELEEGSSAVLKKGNLTKIFVGGIFGFILVILFGIPILLVSIGTPVSSIIKVTDCSSVEGSGCEENGLASFVEKAKNFFLYGSFEKSNKLIATKAVETSNEIFEETEVNINIPLLLSTVFSDVTDSFEKYETDDLTNVNGKNLLDRLKYFKEVGLFQIIEDSAVFECKAKEVDGKMTYYTVIDTSFTDPSTITETECNEENVGKLIKETVYQLNIEKYYELLKEKKDILAKIYGDEQVSTKEGLEQVIDSIRMNREVFKILYEDETEENGSTGNIPLSVMRDQNINLQSPLKGNIGVTSPYGNRTGIFAGRHLGMDLVSNDKNIYATGDGVVTRANTETLGGKVIEITHTTSDGKRYISQYGHLSQFLVSVGDRVKAGEIIGIMGDTGKTSGVHLHFQMWNVDTKETYNPANLFNTN